MAILSNEDIEEYASAPDWFWEAFETFFDDDDDDDGIEEYMYSRSLDIDRIESALELDRPLPKAALRK